MDPSSITQASIWAFLAIGAACGLGASGITQATKASIKEWASDHDGNSPLWARIGLMFLPLIVGSLLGLALGEMIGNRWAIMAGLGGGTLSSAVFNRAKALVNKFNIKLPGQAAPEPEE